MSDDGIVTASVASLLARYPVPAGEAWRTTVTLARVRTRNQARNQVPEDAEALLDIRFPAGPSLLEALHARHRNPPRHQ